jgi:lysophospholipase L1-like esterase
MVRGNCFDFLGFGSLVDLRTLNRWAMSMISAQPWRRVSLSWFAARLFAIWLTLLTAATAIGQESTAPSATQHPALFLVGDSIMKTGAGNGERGPWGWGSEIVGLFDPTKIHVYNEGRGGRSSRSYIAEGLWAKILERLQAGDFVIVQFGHNDAANSQNYPDRVSVKGSGEETQEIVSPKSNEKETVHSYGWYLRQYATEAKAKGATLIICSPVPRNTWTDGKIKRGFDGYAQWAAEAAKAMLSPPIGMTHSAKRTRPSISPIISTPPKPARG